MAKRQMLINYVPGEECRIAIVEGGKLEELYQERASAESHVGNIYKGRVTNVEPSIQAVFVDFGLERNGFLHVSDLHPKYFGGDNEDVESVGQRTPRRDRPPIQQCLRRGQEMLVQVLKEGIGTKGPTLTSYLSIPGRFLVMMPDMRHLGVSRKVEDDEQRREMRKLLDGLAPPKEFGFIIRTAGLGQTKAELKRDLAYLQRLWKIIEQRRNKRGVGELYTESDLIIRTIRDIFSTDIEQIVVDNAQAARRASDFLAIASPRARSRVMVYTEPVPLFDRYGIEQQIDHINARTVPLPSGGSLVIDSTEALVAIDVNSGKMRDNRDAETTALKTNLEAVDEICRQLRLRDLGGVIVNDLIDMRHAKNRRQVEQRFRENLKDDRARTKVLAISQLGILEMTRQRMRPSLKRSIYEDCPHCEGSGHVKSAESVVLTVMRRLAMAMQHKRTARITLTISPDVAFQLLNRKRADLAALERRHNVPVLVRVSNQRPDVMDMEVLDERGGAVVYDKIDHNKQPQLETIDQALEHGDAQPEHDTREYDQAPLLEPEPEPDQSHDEDDEPHEHTDEADDDASDKPRKRRRRGGRRRRKKKTDAADGEQGAEAAEAPPEPEPEPEADPEPDEAESSDQAPTKPKRRRRSRRRGKKDQPADQPEAAGSDEQAPAAEQPAPEPEPTPDDAGDAEAAAPKKKRPRRRRKKKSDAEAEADGGQPAETDAVTAGSGYSNQLIQKEDPSEPAA